MSDWHNDSRRTSDILRDIFKKVPKAAPAAGIPNQGIEWGLPVADGTERVEWGGTKAFSLPDPEALIGVEDAFDHTPLEAGEQVAFCRRDQGAYHIGTWEFLKNENGGNCCICGKGDALSFITLAPGGTMAAKKEIERLIPPGLTLIGRKDIEQYLNRAVLFEDQAYEVYRTKHTGTVFIRFERRWGRQPVFTGFKAVIFKRYLGAWEKAGIDPDNYAGRKIRVRGLIQTHPEWGMEIIVNSPRLIQVME